MKKVKKEKEGSEPEEKKDRKEAEKLSPVLDNTVKTELPNQQDSSIKKEVFLRSFSDYIIVAKDKILIVALLIIIFNPIPGGVIVSIGLLSQKETKNEGKWFLPLAFFWGAISLSTTLKYFSGSF